MPKRRSHLCRAREERFFNCTGNGSDGHVVKFGFDSVVTGLPYRSCINITTRASELRFKIGEGWKNPNMDGKKG